MPCPVFQMQYKVLVKNTLKGHVTSQGYGGLKVSSRVLVNLRLFHEEIIFVICDIVLYLSWEYTICDFPDNSAYKIRNADRYKKYNQKRGQLQKTG